MVQPPGGIRTREQPRRITIFLKPRRNWNGKMNKCTEEMDHVRVSIAYIMISYKLCNGGFEPI